MTKYMTALAAVALLFGSCTKGLGWEEEQNEQPNPEPPIEGKLELTADKYEIVADGVEFAQLTVKKGDVVLSAGDVKIYNDKNEVLTLPELKFSTTTVGKHLFWASDGKSYTETIEINAVEPQEVPGGGDDPQPNPDPTPDPDADNLNFKRRVLMTQFTGTQCGFCPFMINMLNEMFTNPYVSENAILVAAHRYNSNDPAYLEGTTLNYAMSVSSYPTLNFDMHTNSSQYNSVAFNENILNQELSRVKVRGGISANSQYDSATRTVTVTAQVKAAEEHDFRIGAWLIQDKIVGTQGNNGAPGEWRNYVHNNSIIYCDSKRSSTDYTGHDLGTIAKGATAEYTFKIELREEKENDQRWNADNCRLVLFITTPEVIGTTRKYYVNNAIALPLNGQQSFEYTKE